MYQPAPGKSYEVPMIKRNDENLLAADNFIYLGSTLSLVALIDGEINSRIAKASAGDGH